MKNLMCLFLMFSMFWSCQGQVENPSEINTLSKKLQKQANTDDVNSFQPPWSNPIMKELANPEKNLNKVDSIYREEIEKSNAKAYYQNLREFGFEAIIEHGLIKEGTKEQKLYYINEQLNSMANIINIGKFYDLLISSRNDFSNKELLEFGEKFYSKNYKVLSTGIKFPTEEEKSKYINQLNTIHDNFLKHMII